MEERDVMIVGGSPAGLCGIIGNNLHPARRLEHTVAGKLVGVGQVAIAYTVSNYPDFPPGDGAVMENIEKQVDWHLQQELGAELRQLLPVVSIGHPAETPEKGRKGLDEITFTNKYGLHTFEN